MPDNDFDRAPSAPEGARPRLVATDLDGTFLGADGRVTEYSASIWNALPTAGIETVLVTARPPRWLHDLAHVVGPRGVALCGNGAFIYEVASRRLLETNCFAPGLVEEICADLRRAIPSVTFAAERASGSFREDTYPDPHRDDVAHTEVGSVELIGAQPVGKLLALAPGLPIDAFLAQVADVVGERAHLAYSGAYGLAELNPIGVTKARALANWCAGLGIEAADVWAFGDMPNDLPMLTWAGRGYAVANGHPDVLAAASHRCPANDEDGVARTVAEFIRRDGAKV